MQSTKNTEPKLEQTKDTHGTDYVSISTEQIITCRLNQDICMYHAQIYMRVVIYGAACPLLSEVWWSALVMTLVMS